MSKRDLLRKLRSVRSTERGIVLDQAWVLRTRSRLMEQARSVDAPLPISTSLRLRKIVREFIPVRTTQWMRAPVLATLAIFAAVLGSSLVSVSAAERSVPGDFLYPVKIAGEQTRLAFTQDKADRVRLKTEFVDRRVEEIKSIARTPETKNPELLREAAVGLKRDLDTVKNQLNEVKEESSAPVTAELAKFVDRKTDQVSQELKQVKTDASPAAKRAMADAEAQAVQTSVAAMAVLIEMKTAPDAQNIASDEEVAQVLDNKIHDLQNSIDGSIERLISVSASGTFSNQSVSGTLLNTLSMTTSSTAPQLASASTTLGEAKALIIENKLDQATDKLAEAAKATAQAVAATELFMTSSTAMTPLAEVPSSSTSSSEASVSSTTPTTSGSTATTPP